MTSPQKKGNVELLFLQVFSLNQRLLYAFLLDILRVVLQKRVFHREVDQREYLSWAVLLNILDDDKLKMSKNQIFVKVLFARRCFLVRGFLFLLLSFARKIVFESEFVVFDLKFLLGVLMILVFYKTKVSWIISL